jgi:hypothetical protein
VFLRPECRQGGRDFRLLLEAGKLIRPGALAVQMSAQVGHQVTPAFSFVVACDLVVRVAQDRFARMGLRTVSGQPEQGQAWMSGQPWLDRLCFVDSIMIRHEIDPFVTLRWIRGLDRVEQVSKQGVGFALPEAGMNDSRANIPSCGEVRLLVFARCKHCGLCALPHPRRAGLGQPGEIEFVDQQEGWARPKRFHRPTKGGPLGGAWRIMVPSDELGPWPAPAQALPPAPHAFRRHAYAPPGFPAQGQAGTTPARAAPAARGRRFRPERPETALPRRSQEERRISLGGWLRLSRPPALPPGSGHFLDRGARAQEPGGNLGGRTLLRSEQKNVQAQQPTEQTQAPPPLPPVGLFRRTQVDYHRRGHGSLFSNTRLVGTSGVANPDGPCPHYLVYGLLCGTI